MTLPADAPDSPTRPSPPQSTPRSIAALDLTAIGEWLAGRRFLGLGLVLIVLARTGVYLSNGKAIWLEESRTFPSKPSFIYESFGYLGPPHVLGISSLGQWAVLGVAIAVASAAVIGLGTRDLDPSWRTAVRLTVAVSSFPTIVLYNIGWYDTLTILGAAIVAIGRHPVWAVAGVAVMASANPSEAVAAAVALLLIAIAGRWDELGSAPSPRWRRRSSSSAGPRCGSAPTMSRVVPESSGPTYGSRSSRSCSRRRSRWSRGTAARGSWSSC